MHARHSAPIYKDHLLWPCEADIFTTGGWHQFVRLITGIAVPYMSFALLYLSVPTVAL